MPSARGKKADKINRLNKSFDRELAKARAEVEAATHKAGGSSAKPAAPSSAAAGNTEAPLSFTTSALFATMAVGPCAAIFASPKFGVTLADKGALLVVVAVISVVFLTHAYDAHVQSAQRHALESQGSRAKHASMAELQSYAIYFVNLCFLLLFLVVGFFILPTVGGLVPVPNDVVYFTSVAGAAAFVYLWQKGIILKGLA